MFVRVSLFWDLVTVTLSCPEEAMENEESKDNPVLNELRLLQAVTKEL